MVYVFLAKGFEEVEALTPVDYLRRCDIEVKTVGIGGRMIEGSRGISVMADLTIFDIDMNFAKGIILPGGMPGALNLEHSPQVCDIVRKAVNDNIVVGAICAAPSILGHMNLLVGKRATCAEGFEGELHGAEYTGEPVEISGNIITARGAGVANQFAFALCEKLADKARADKLKAAIRY